MTVPATHRTRTGRLRGEKHEVRTLWADRLASRTGRWRIRARPAGTTLQEKTGHYTSRYKTFDGLFAATRRRVFRRNPDNTVNLNLPSITLDIHDVELVRCGEQEQP